MQGRKGTWLTGVLTGTLLCGMATGALGQTLRQPYMSPNSAYTVVSDVRVPDAGPLTSSAPNHLMSNTAFSDEGGGLAAIEARLAKIEDSAAAAKKKAAGKPSVTFGGRIYADYQLFSQDTPSITQIGNQQNGFRFDTVRMYAKGTAFQVMDYKVQFDFAGTQSATTGSTGVGALAHTHSGGTLQASTFKDVYIGFKELPLAGHVKIGHFKEPFSLDQLTSSRFITFMERSLIDKAFVPGRNVGIMASDYSESENLTWALGAFIADIGDEPPIYKDDNTGMALTTRVTWLPWYDEATEGRGLLHLGLGYSYRDMHDGDHRFRTKPENDLSTYILDTGTLTGLSDVQLIGLEAAYVYGAFRIQSEYIKAFVGRRSGAGDAELDGVYFQMSYFLTGEQRKYKRTAGTFSDRVKPFEPFFRVRTENGNICTGKGAWEVAYRFSSVDLNNGAITGGNATNHTFGVNWYFNPYARMMFDYINSDARHGGHTGNMNIFAVRTQIDF